MNPYNIAPGNLTRVGDDGNGASIGLVIYYIVALIVFFAYAKAEFSLFGAIMYSLFWPYCILYELIF